jgi:SWI/SNF-related matrix-associated actin-dependent regulator 1 of chromatin subfamily A
MKLDYQPAKRLFTLHVARGETDLDALVKEHGLDYSLPASTPAEACLFTAEPYAAVAFGEFATAAARNELAPLLAEIAASWALTPARPSALWPGHLKPDDKDPYPLQLADLEYALSRQNTLVADEPGVGKTPTAIMYANMLSADRAGRDKFRALAIVPASIRLQWAHRIREWSTIPNTKISVVSTSSRGVPPTSSSIHWTILSYDTARSPAIYKAILANHYDLLVIDEAHYLKSPSAARTRAVFGAADRGNHISERASHVLALTGTPIPNRPREAFILAKSLCYEAIDFVSERAFNERFNPRAPRENERGRVIGVREATGRYPELQARLRASFMVRHLFADAFPQLRLPVYDLVYADDTAPVRAALEAERLLDIDPETFTFDGKIDGAVSTARKLMGLALAPQVVQYVKMLHAGGDDKIVVFAWHIEVMDILQKGLDSLGVVRVDGRTSEAQKAKAIVAFQTDPTIGVILGNVLSLGTGTDGLQHVSRRAVLAEPEWVSGNNEQCFKRLHRSGQTGQVLGDIFVAHGSLAEHILGASLRKGRVIHSALDARVALGG